MDTKDQEFLKRLQATFRDEAEEHIKILYAGLIELEKNPKNKKSLELIEIIFREAHSLKGAARSVNRNDIESICQVLESAFAKLKNEQFALTVTQFDLFLRALDTISKMVPDTGTKKSGEYRELIKQLHSITEADKSGKIDEEPTTEKIDTEETITVGLSPNGKPVATALLSDERLAQTDTVRIPMAKIDPLFLQAEQMIQFKISGSQLTAEMKAVIDLIELWKAELRKWDSPRYTGSLIQLKKIYDWNNEKLNELESKIAAVTNALENYQRSIGRMIDDHLELMKSILMLPVSTIIEGFPKLVRDLARSQGKEVELIVHGSEIEVDKRVLEELKDPLIHLVRNCIDHGIKKPHEREHLNKPSQGKVRLSFNATDSRHLEIVISDDGAGIDPDKVSRAAIKAGVIAKDSLEHLNPQETLSLIFQSGVSTSQMITDLSGRGLGLAIVLEKVEKLGGSVSIESQPDIGTSFRLVLPLTLATFRGILVRGGEHLVVIPTINVERAVRINREVIQTVENRETIMIDGKILKTVSLVEVLGFSKGINGNPKKSNSSASPLNMIQLLILVHADKRIAFMVDEILEERQILVKELGRQLNRVRNISGATVLGSGKVVPVINVADIIKSAIRTEMRINEAKEKEVVRRYKILVVDDSITSRSLIKSIVESAGYIVETAFDGQDAFMKAQAGAFDLIVSDVDMPRMNGFELTTKIRKEKKLSELPVILVTALESSEDREHGIDVGANAYIVKSSFDQSNLLEVITKLL